MNCDKYDSDPDFVAAIRNGGREYNEAVECLYKRYRHKALESLERTVRHNSRHRNEIADLSQDAFIIMTQKITDGGYNDGSLLHFWIGIAKGLLRNKVKKDSKLDLVENTLEFDSIEGDSPESLMISAQQAEMLDRLLDRIGDRCKQVMILWANGYSMREIKEILVMSSEAMARKTKFKCKQKLLDLLEDTAIEIL